MVATNEIGPDRLRVLATGFDLVEAPTPDGSGGLYFTDAHAGTILHRDAAGTTVVLEKDRITGGVALHASGSVVWSGPSIAERSADGTWRTLFEIPDDHGVTRTFNDIVALPDGSVVGGTLVWPARPNGDRKPSDLRGPDAIDGEVWRVTAEGEAHVVFGPTGVSNGVEVAPDGETIFFADTKSQTVHHLRITDGTFELINDISTAEVGLPDGVAVDAEGGVWVSMTGAGVVARFAPTGELLATVAMPAKRATSLVFAGTTSTDLVIGTAKTEGVDDAGGSILILDAGVAGAVVHQATI